MQNRSHRDNASRKYGAKYYYGTGGIELDGVEIVREMPVSIKGDTIVYNTDSFKTGEERKLEDVFKTAWV
jgi:hypothetical protein